MSVRSPERPRVDPRVRQRRADVARRHGRRRLYRLGAVVAAMVLMVGAWKVVHSSVIGVRHLTVIGNQRQATAEVLGAAGIDEGDPMISLDLDRARHDIGALPWIDSVTVRRQWPASVVISVTERIPVAASATSTGGWRLIDRTGRVVADLAVLTAGVPTVSGPQGPSEPGTRMPPQSWLAYEAIARVPAALAGIVVGASWSTDGSTAVSLESGVDVLMPDASLVGDAFVSLSAMIDQAQAPAAGDLIDLRVPSNPVVRSASTLTGVVP